MMAISLVVTIASVLCTVAAERLYTATSRLPTPHPCGLNGTLTVASAQMSATDTGNLSANVAKHVDYVQRAARAGARVVVFPEESVTGYSKDFITTLSQAELTAAESTIAAACREHGIYAIVGIPHFFDDKAKGAPSPLTGPWYNTALVIDPHGDKIYRQAKLYACCDADGTAGTWLGTFQIDNITSSIAICFDEFFPEVVRLPVMAGSRLLFYLSHEAPVTMEYRTQPARAQVVARAQENQIFVVQANAGAMVTRTAVEAGVDMHQIPDCHGQSRVVDPWGTVLAEAPVFGEDLLVQTLDLTKLPAAGGGWPFLPNVKNMGAQLLFQKFWEAGLALMEPMPIELRLGI